MPLRKEYLLVSSDDRMLPTRQTTTNFICQLPNPIGNIVKTDLVSVSADYRIANITAPNNSFSITYWNYSTTDIETEVIYIQEALYTNSELLVAIVQAINDTLNNTNALSVCTGILIGSVIRLELEFPQTPTTTNEQKFTITCTSPTFRVVLGMTSTSISGTYISSIGLYGGSRITMPSGITLTGLFPYFLIQSVALGNDTMTTKGLYFWRAIVNNPYNTTLEVANNRTDDYVYAPKMIYEIDVRIIFPNGSIVDNRGGTFAFLVELVILEELTFDEKVKLIQPRPPMIYNRNQTEEEPKEEEPKEEELPKLIEPEPEIKEDDATWDQLQKFIEDYKIGEVE